MDSLPQMGSDMQEYIGDDWLLTGQDFLEPICYADEATANEYARNHCCAICLSQLTYKVDYVTDGFIVVCPECGEITKSNAVSNNKAQQARDSIRLGEIEIKAASKPKRTEAEILAELGF